jgi:hypothetical protein
MHTILPFTLLNQVAIPSSATPLSNHQYHPLDEGGGARDET